MNLSPGQRVRWYRYFASRKRAELVDAIVVRRSTDASIVILVAGVERIVRAENLMPAMPAGAE